MRNFISVRLASNGLLGLLFPLIIFHILILTRFIPYGVVWGGRIESESQMFRAESISILVNVLLILLVCVHRGLIEVRLNKAILSTGLWVMFVLFALNTLGNALSQHETEKWLAPVTFLLAIFSLRLALDK